MAKLSSSHQEQKTFSREVRRQDFPPDFVFGVATSAYQVEGASNEGGRGASIWDVFSHIEGNIKDKSNGDAAVDQYHRYKEDVELISKLGFDAYRFSISWSRIFPDGLGTKANEEGIAYYNNLINALLEKGIQPYVTIYHWDLPANLHESMGGWLSENIVKYYSLFAETCFASFGDRVKHWITINEALQTSVNGYHYGIFAPGRISLTEPYLAAHHQLLAHATAVSLYKEKFKAQQGGEIGFVAYCEWAEPFSDKLEDKDAAQRFLDFHLGWFLDPIFFGDYPKVMRERLGDRLPKFSDEDKKLLSIPVDFVGLNNYTTKLIAHAAKVSEDNDFYQAHQIGRAVAWPHGEPIGERAASDWLYIAPWGMRKILNYVSEKYNNPPIYVTENGMDDEDDPKSLLHEVLDDQKRIDYFKGYLGAVAQSIRDGTNVKGYFVWSLLDNMEWAQGYTKRFGIVFVDYKNGLTRHPKSSALWFSRFLKGGETKDAKED